MPTFLRLELENFKSYRTPTTIEWKQVSSIIGQNGTGKSTIIDAVEFVFCFPRYQRKSVENLRNELYNKNSEDNEHSSSTVSAVVIVNDEEREFKRAIDYNESVQKYWISDRMVNHNEYTKFLMEVNINPRANNFLVQQNTIESLALKNAKQRTKFFEVLSNSIVYKSEYDGYKGDMESMKAEVNTLKSILDLHIKEKKNVNLKSQEIQLYDKLTEDLEETEINYYLTKLYEIEFTVKRLHSEEIEEKRTLMVAEKIAHKYQTNIERFNDEIAENEGQITVIETDLENLQPTILNHKNKVETLKEKIKLYASKIESAEKQLEQAKIIHNQHLKIIEDLKIQLSEVENQKDAFCKSFAQSSSIELDESQYTEYCSLRNEAEKLIVEGCPHISTLERERDGIRDQINEYENQTKILLDQIKIEKSIIKEINDKIKNVCQKIDETTSKLSEAEIQDRELGKEIEQLRSRVEDTINKIQDCNKQLSNMDVEEHESNNQRRLQEIENTLKLKFGDKILGRLTNLCRVKSKQFEIAITKILGNNMDAIIVDTTKTATECVAYVKVQYSGDRYPAIATYIPMDRLRQKTLPHGILKEIESTSYAVLAMNVMDPGQYDRVLNSFLGDIVISKTHDQAMELSKSLKINCVSQNGTYFKKSGLFSGGCKDLEKKARKWSDAEYTKIETEKETNTKLLRELQCQLRDKECGRNSEAQRYRYCLEKYLKPKFEKLEQELSTKEKNLAELENKLQALKSASKIDDLKRLLEPINRNLNHNEHRRREIEDKVFFKFCKKHKLTDIRKYEETDVREYQEISEKKMEFDHHLGKIQNQLAHEENRNTEENLKKIGKMLSKMKKDKEKLSNELKKQGSHASEYEQFAEYEKKIKSIRCDIAKKKKNVLIEKRALDKAKEDVNARKKKVAGLNFKMNQLQRVEVHQILTTCKMKGIDIALKKGTIEKVVIDSRSHDTESETSGQNTESDSAIQEKNVEIDFSKLDKKVKKFDETELHDYLKELNKRRQELASKLESCTPSNRNLKEELDSLKTKIKSAKANWIKKREQLETIQKNFEEVKTDRKKLFDEFFDSVEKEIDKIFKDLYNQPAAQALLIAKNPEEPYLDGIDLSILIPGKKWTRVDNLSGGEKTMCAMALFLAIYKAKPAPCIIFDEIDAALDNANLQNIVTLFMQWKQTTQIISISHHENLFRCSDAAIGIGSSVLRNSSYPIHVDLNQYLQPISWSPSLPYSPRSPTGSSRKPLTSTPNISLNRKRDVRLPSLSSSIHQSSKRLTMEPPTVPHATSSGIIIRSVENVRFDNITIRKRKIRKSEEDDS